MSQEEYFSPPSYRVPACPVFDKTGTYLLGWYHHPQVDEPYINVPEVYKPMELGELLLSYDSAPDSVTHNTVFLKRSYEYSPNQNTRRVCWIHVDGKQEVLQEILNKFTKDYL